MHEWHFGRHFHANFVRASRVACNLRVIFTAAGTACGVGEWVPGKDCNCTRTVLCVIAAHKS